MFLPPGFSIAANGQVYSADGRGPYPLNQAGFFFGRIGKAALDLNIPSGQKVLLKFIVGVDTLLRNFGAILDNGHAKVTLYKDGTPTGTFSISLNTVKTNWSEDAPVYDFLNGIWATPPGSPSLASGVFLDSFRIKTANQANQSQSVGGSVPTELGLGVGIYYALVENIGTGAVEGILSALWEEVPNS